MKFGYSTYVMMLAFLSQFGFEILRDLPNFERLQDAGLFSKDRLLAGDVPFGLNDGMG